MLYNNPNKTYTSPQGRPFRVISLEKIEGSERWDKINRVLKYKWKAVFKMLDDNTLIEYHTGYNDEEIYKAKLSKSED